MRDSRKIHIRPANLFFMAIIMFFVITISLVLDRSSPELSKITGAAIVGTRTFVITPVFITCNVSFQPGFNLVSFPCLEESGIDKSNLTDYIYGFSSIHYYNYSDEKDPWKAYSPGLPNWTVVDFDKVEKGKGYWINFNNSNHFYSNGTMININPLEIQGGWNLVGYFFNESKPINQTLASIENDLEIIFEYNATSMTWANYTSNNSQENKLTHFKPYYGYWIKVYNRTEINIIQ